MKKQEAEEKRIKDDSKKQLDYKEKSNAQESDRSISQNPTTFPDEKQESD